MKRLLLILMFLLPALAFGQKHTYFGTPTTIDSFNLTMWIRQFKMPTTPLINTYFDSAGSVYLNTTTGTVYYHDGFGWQPIAGGGGGGGLQHVGGWLKQTNDTVSFDTVQRLDYVLANTDLKIPTSKAVRTAAGDTAAAIRAATVPYAGATANVNLGTYNIIPNSVQLSTSPSGTLTGVGQMYWDAANVTASMPLDADVTMQIGQETFVRARNSTGAILTNGTAVYINSAQGNNPTIAKANADSASTSYVIGVTTEDIGINATGFVTVTGVVNGVNTSAWNAGDRLYLDTVLGGITKYPPPSPHILTYIGQALNSTNNGRIFVRPSQPLATDTNLLNGTTVAPTQYAVRTYVSKRQLNSDTTTWDATRSWVNGRGFGTGTVTSVGLANGYGLSVSGSPVTGAGTITATVDTSAGKTPTQYRVDTASGNTRSWVVSQSYGTGTIKALTGDVTASGTGTVTAALATVNASPATYTNATVTVDSKGRVTSASSGTAPVTSVSGTSGRVSSTGGTTPVIDLVTVNATPATYGSASAIPVVTVDAYGRATTITTVSPATNGTVTSIQIVGGTGATVTPTTAVTTSGVYTVTPEVSSATFNTLTNKRITYRTGGAASYTTSVTIASDSVDMFVITAQAGALLFNQPSGTPTQGQMLLIRIKDNGTARALTWNSVFRAGTDVTLPTTTTISKTLYMEFLYNTTDSKWDIVGKADGY